MTLAGSPSVVGGAHIQAFTFFVSRSRSVVRGAMVCVVCVVCCVGVGVRSWWCCVLCGCCVGVVWWVVVWCGVWVLCWCCVGVGWCVCVFFSFFSQFSSFSFSFSQFSSLFLRATKHCARTDQPTWRPTSRRSDVTWDGSLPHPLSSLLPSPPPPPLPRKKEERTFYYRNISGEGIIFITVSD